jgi:L-alanine-DL-glutamate epimerase-like enolase superfamily enzyme
LEAYKTLATKSGSVKLAGGEGCHNLHQARNMLDYAGLGYIQIDAGRIGGITTAKAVADYAVNKGVQFVNHTFTTPLSLSASLQPYAGLKTHDLCEYPWEPSRLAQEIARTRLAPNADGLTTAPSAPGLGIELAPAALKKYLVEVEIRVGGRLILKTLPRVD